MPTAVEKWLVDRTIRYRISGIMWSGRTRVRTLEIQFNPEEKFVPVDNFYQPANDPWSFWTHAWAPQTVGTYSIKLRVADPEVRARKMNAGHYVRRVEITEV
jgi:hypothetical protein